MTLAMRADDTLAIVYSIVIAAMTLLYIGYGELGFLNHAAANSATQVEADDD